MDTRIDPGRSLRGAVEMCTLFVASFAVTHWVISPESTVTASPLPQNAFTLPGSTEGASSASPATSAHDAVDFWDAEPPTEPAPSLQDLATDNDPETRGEAQALLGLLDQERTLE